MYATFPGTTLETTSLHKGSSRQLFDGIFATGGITLSQVSIMTGLEPYLVQNWVKRGFIGNPQKRVYSQNQFSRIVIINMLRESLQIDKICGLIKTINGVLDDERDDLIGAGELYHRYVDMLAENEIDIRDPDSVSRAAEMATSDFDAPSPHAQKQLTAILKIMLYAHAASSFKSSAEEILSTMK